MGAYTFMHKSLRAHMAQDLSAYTRFIYFVNFVNIFHRFDNTERSSLTEGELRMFSWGLLLLSEDA
jgi:hypothetical protein